MVTVFRELARMPGFIRSVIIAVTMALILVTVLAVLLRVSGPLVSFCLAHFHAAGSLPGAS